MVTLIFLIVTNNREPQPVNLLFIFQKEILLLVAVVRTSFGVYLLFTKVVTYDIRTQ